MSDLKLVRIPATGTSVNANNSGIFDLYTGESVKGKIIKLEFDYNNTTSTGSVWLFTSGGINENIFYIKGFSPDVTAYPRVLITTSGNVALDYASGNPFTEFCANQPLRLIGSGLGSNLIFNGCNIYYSSY